MKKSVLIIFIIVISISSLILLIGYKKLNAEKQVIEQMSIFNYSVTASSITELLLEIDKLKYINPCKVEPFHKISHKYTDTYNYLDECFDRKIKSPDEEQFPTDLLNKYLTDFINEVENNDSLWFKKEETIKIFKNNIAYSSLMKKLLNKSINNQNKLQLINCKALLANINREIILLCLREIPPHNKFLIPEITITHERIKTVGNNYYLGDVFIRDKIVVENSKIIIAHDFDSINNKYIDVIDTLYTNNGIGRIFLKKERLKKGLNSLFIFYLLPTQNKCSEQKKYNEYYKKIKFTVEK